MKEKLGTNQAGFTLIETMMAMAIFTIGILGLFGMQTAAIKENLAANDITTGTTWAVDEIEKMIGGPLVDADSDGCGGLDDATDTTADYGPVITQTQPSYTIYSNVATNCTNVLSVQHLRMIVSRTNGSGLRDGGKVAVINYIKNTYPY